MTKETQVLSTRDSLRASIFSSENSRCKRVPITLNGAELELKQPTIDEVIKLQDRPEASARVAIILINHAFIPGTEDKVFDDADYDSLAALPYTPELTAIQEVLNTFLIGDQKATEKN